MMHRRVLGDSTAIAVLMAAGLLVGTSAVAQENGEEATPAMRAPVAEGAADGAQETILVTARKREESIQDIPLSVSAFTATDIRDLGVDDLSELSAFTPGFFMETFGGRRGAEGDTQRPVIRGQANILGETNAQVFVDGIPYSGSFLSFPFAAIERVEVVKGPQAALFGRSTFAGAINVITKQGSNERENLVTTKVAFDENDGDWNSGLYEVNASSSGALIEDQLFYFLHGRYYDYAGIYKNTQTGDTIGDEQSYGLNGSLEFRPSENFNFVLRAGYNEDDDGVPAQVAQSRFFNNCLLDRARQYYCGEVLEFDAVTLDTPRLMGEDGLERDITRVSGTAVWDIDGTGDGFVVTANAGWTDYNSVFGADATFLGNPTNFAGGSLVRVEILDREEWSAELRLDTPSTERIRGTLGVFYYESDLLNFRRRPASTTLIADFGTSYTENRAVFGRLEGDITDAMTAGVELRYQEDTIGNNPAAGGNLEETFDSVLPRFTLDYNLSEDVLLYGVAAKGNKPGFINTDPALPEELRFADEEEAWSYEIGAKNTLADGAITLNLAAYYIDWTNQQLSTSLFPEGALVPQSVVFNVGESEVMGLEVEGNWVVSPSWLVGMTYAYSNAEITDFCDPIQGNEIDNPFPVAETDYNCFNEDGVGGGQVAGKKIPNAPEHQFTASTTYMRPLGAYDLDWFVRGDYSYMSTMYAQVHNLAETGDRHLLNLKAGLDRGNARLTFFVDNVLDDRTPSTVVRYADLGVLNLPGTNPGRPELDNVPGSTATERAFLFPLAQPRRYGVTLSYEF